METAIGQSALLQALGWAVFNSLWQMSILWVAYQLITASFQVKRSSRKNFLAVFLLFTGFGWFIATFLSSLTDSNAAAAGYTGLIHFAHNPGVNKWLGSLLPVASLLYLVLLIFPVLNLVRNYRYVQVIRRYGLSRADAQWRMFVQKIGGHMGIGKQVHVWMSDLVSSPVTIGYIKPIILLPIAAVNHLTPQQTEAVLLHELSHIKRADYFINLLVKCIQALLYFNPFVKAFAKIIEREREKNCDETVMQFQYEPHGYASALLALEKAAHVPRHAFALAASDGRKSEFRKRIEWIMGINSTPVFSFTKLAGVIVALFCFIGLNALLIMNKPANKDLVKDSFSLLSSPYAFFSGNGDEPASKPPHYSPEIKRHSILNTQPFTAGTINTPAEKDSTDLREDAIAEATPASSPYQYINNLEEVVPQLRPDQEKQVEIALQQSKKVLQEKRWKEVEATIADAMTDAEKQLVKDQYTKTLNKVNWEQVGDQLRIAYDNIDWNTVNAQLNNAIATIRIDSLENVYTMALHSLNELQRELKKTNQPGVPDTDVTLGTIETTKKAMLSNILKLRAAKPRKIVRL